MSNGAYDIASLYRIPIHITLKIGCFITTKEFLKIRLCFPYIEIFGVDRLLKIILSFIKFYHFYFSIYLLFKLLLSCGHVYGLINTSKNNIDIYYFTVSTFINVKGTKSS